MVTIIHRDSVFHAAASIITVLNAPTNTIASNASILDTLQMASASPAAILTINAQNAMDNCNAHTVLTNLILHMRDTVNYARYSTKAV